MSEFDRNYDALMRRATHMHPSVGRRSGDTVIDLVSSKDAAAAYARVFPGAQMPSETQTGIVYAVDSFGYARKVEVKVPLIEPQVKKE
jgi:hypothetical protein